MTDAIKIQRQEKKYKRKTEHDQESYYNQCYICAQELLRILKMNLKELGKAML